MARRRHGIQPNQLFAWRKLASQGDLTAHRVTKPSILGLQLFRAFDLIVLQATVLIAPPIVCCFRRTHRSDCVCYLLVLCDHHISLPKLRNDLFSRMPLPHHRSYSPSENHTSRRTTSKEADHPSQDSRVVEVSFSDMKLACSRRRVEFVSQHFAHSSASERKLSGFGFCRMLHAAKTTPRHSAYVFRRCARR